MRKKVKGKVYDTEQAEWQADSEYCYRDDMGVYFQDRLYRKRNGAYFLHTTYYGVKTNGVLRKYMLKEEITPISVDGAISWGQEFLFCEDYSRVFLQV